MQAGEVKKVQEFKYFGSTVQRKMDCKRGEERTGGIEEPLELSAIDESQQELVPNHLANGLEKEALTKAGGGRVEDVKIYLWRRRIWKE